MNTKTVLLPWLFLASLTYAPMAAAEVLRIDGEVYAQRTSALVPPSVDRMWQFNITQLAPDGSPVKKGDIVVAFDSNDLTRQLADAQSQLQEKQRELENLDLDLAERQRSAALETAEAQSKMEKAQRKTEQPRELVAALQYDKLMDDRRRTEKRAALSVTRERLAAEQRRQERRLTVSELTKLQADVTRLQKSLAALVLQAPRSGIMMHKSSWNGEKFDVGSQIFRGQTLAEIPDDTTLAVRAELPERDLRRVAVGARARIVVEGGGGGAHLGKVVSIGRAVRSKSQVQPIPVLDVEIRLDDPKARLRPGQAVRVELTVPGAKAGKA